MNDDLRAEYGMVPPGATEGDLARTRRRKPYQRRPSRDGGTATEDRLPPHTEECERGVLSCIMQSPATCMGECVEKFRGKDVFFDLRHQTIYHVLREMYDKQEAIDTILLQQKLRDKNVLEQVGGIAYLSELPDVSPSPVNLSYYAAKVWEKYLLRTATHVFQEAVDSIYGFEGDAEELLMRVESAVSALTESHTTVSEEHIKAPLRRVMTELEENSYRRGSTQLRGLPMGPPGNYLDKIVLGVRRKYYIVLAGRPGSGKTSEGMNLVEYWACDFEWWQPCTEEEAKAAMKEVHGSTESRPTTYQNEETKQWHRQRKGIPVCVFSIEMDADSLTERLLFGRAGVTTSDYRQGFAEKNATEKLLGAFTKLAQSEIYIDSTPGQTIGQIAAKARRMVKQYGLKNTPPEVPPMVFVLDYIQLVEMEGSDGFDRQKEITKISRKIMSLKKQLECPWIVLAQMNRNIETAERDRKPVLSDLKDCGALEQDADLVLFTYKTPRKELERVPESGGPSQEEILEAVCNKPGAEWPWSQVPYRVDFVIPKNRFGPTGDAQMVFCKNLCRFEDWHLWKVKNNVEGLKAGESKRLIEPPC